MNNFFAKGVNGQLTVTPTKVIISRKGMLGLLSQGLKGNKEIRIRDISSIQFKKAGYAFNGYIQFAFLGGHETKGGIFDATKDENSIIFTKKQQKMFEEAKARIEQYQNQAASPVAQPSSEYDDLEKLNNLKIKGIITEEEFQAKKKQILGL